jgi:multiple sugar transport system substrate-binding protein
VSGRRRALRTLAALALALPGACANRAERERDALVFRHPKLFGDPRPLDALIGEFERAHRVRVARQTLPASSDEQHLYYAINLSAQTSEFDVFALDTIWTAEFAAAGWLRDVSALVAAEDERDFYAAPLASVSWRGRRYAVPWFVDAGLLYYRSDLVAAPRTWADLAGAIRRVRATHPQMHGFVWQGKQYEGLVCNALEFVWSHGGDLGAGNEGAARGLAFMRALVAEGLSPAHVTTLTEEPSRVLFGRGRALFLRNWPYAWKLLEGESSPVRGRVGVATLPHAAGSAPVATLGGWHLGVNAHSKRPALAERLVAFLTTAASQKALALAYGYSPPRRSLHGALGALFEAARPRPVAPGYVALSQLLQSEFSAVLCGLRAPRAALAAIGRELAA